MKNYTITVNGTAYDVTVEEGGAGSVAAPAAPKKAAAPKAAAPAAAPKKAAAAGAGSVKIEAGAAGKGIQDREEGRRCGEARRCCHHDRSNEDGDPDCRASGRHGCFHRLHRRRCLRGRTGSGYAELKRRAHNASNRFSTAAPETVMPPVPGNQNLEVYTSYVLRC